MQWHTPHTAQSGGSSRAARCVFVKTSVQQQTKRQQFPEDGRGGMHDARTGDHNMQMIQPGVPVHPPTLT
ncbi:hypothetical protein E2C01_007242 [Portunus trituberculatus]|uniref:Uncharacterized protein n=1 Tax=Portunus trituberculatus TaxID=210409 RepID=A0A5B7CZK9_PORTR|nr:hypothetical protein [Portunus trituberculatus]